jgi:hypothetical protein
MRERNFRGAEKFPMSALAATIEREAREILPRVIGRECAKVLAFKAGSTKRSAVNWQNGDHLPSVPHFIALARQYPELKSKVLEWLEASTGENERDPAQVLNDIARLLQQRGP